MTDNLDEVEIIAVHNGNRLVYRLNTGTKIEHTWEAIVALKIGRR